MSASALTASERGVRAEALRDACRAVCEACRHGWPMDADRPYEIHRPPGEGGGSFCQATHIRRILVREALP